jgi:hypothetical protein
MGLTNSRRWWRDEETSVHHLSANNIDQKKVDKSEKTDEVCF